MVRAFSWTRLARRLWLAREDLAPRVEGGARFSRMGTDVAQRALELLLGPENIRAAVELAVACGEGYEVAESVLVHINSEEATRVAYEIFCASEGQRAADAAGLIKHIAHPSALAYVEEFLTHPTASGWGIALLDQLVWSDRVDSEEPEVGRLLALAEAHESEHVREHAAAVRTYVREREQGA